MNRAITRFASALRRLLRQDRSGVAMVEFAYVTPFMLTLGLGGMELANFAVAHLRLNQAAMHIADNASRIGDRDSLSTQRIYESDIKDLFLGVNLQAGEGMDLFENGRVILSSLEQNADGGQWIHWQRCMGTKQFRSSYGEEGEGETGTGFAGMGTPGQEVKAEPLEAVMFVEIAYTYQPLVGTDFAGKFVEPYEIRTHAAFGVRNARDLSRIYQRPTPSPPASCDKFTAEP